MRKMKRSGLLKSPLLFVAAMLLAAAMSQNTQASELAASGSYQLSFEDGYTKYVEFDARSEADGRATGSMTLTDEAAIAEQDVDGSGEPLNRSSSGLTLRMTFDGLAVNRNMAVMSGVVTDSNLENYIGRRVLLVVEDNGDGTEDKIAWGIYKPLDRTWTPSDAEQRDDQGWSLTWIATDEERRDDQGVQITRDAPIDCQTFPFASYEFTAPTRGAGNILVQS